MLLIWVHLRILITKRILCKIPTPWLDDTALTAENKYGRHFIGQQKKFCLSLHYNVTNRYLSVQGFNIYKFKANNSEVNTALLCLGNVAKDFSTNNMQKKPGVYGYVNGFSVDYDTSAVADILNIHEYLLVRNNIK